jgi:hypothetical protein
MRRVHHLLVKHGIRVAQDERGSINPVIFLLRRGSIRFHWCLLCTLEEHTVELRPLRAADFTFGRYPVVVSIESVPQDDAKLLGFSEEKLVEEPTRRSLLVAATATPEEARDRNRCGRFLRQGFELLGQLVKGGEHLSVLLRGSDGEVTIQTEHVWEG